MNIKNLIVRGVSYVSPAAFFRIAYYHNRGHWPNLKNPYDISEIWIRYLLDGKPYENYKLADKYLVREFVKQRIGEDYLTPLLGVWDKPEQIDFSALPNKFVLKMNYGAGMNIICTDKTEFNKENALLKLNKWISGSKKYSSSEAHYNLIDRKIICEEYIEDGNGVFPVDYKFICIHSKPYCILVCSDREKGHANYMPMSLDWQPLPEYNKDNQSYPADKPKNLDEMIQIASKLSDKIDLVRVDLYNVGGKVIFGEMTLTPAGCIFHTWSQKALDEMGEFYHKEK